MQLDLCTGCVCVCVELSLCECIYKYQPSAFEKGLCLRCTRGVEKESSHGSSAQHQQDTVPAFAGSAALFAGSAGVPPLRGVCCCASPAIASPGVASEKKIQSIIIAALRVQRFKGSVSRGEPFMRYKWGGSTYGTLNVLL